MTNAEIAELYNQSENAMGRAMRAAKKGDHTKAVKDARDGIALAQQAIAACCGEEAGEHEHPAPPPPPPPPPSAPAAFTTKPTISPTGHVHVGETLTANPGECPGAVSYEVIWYVEGQPVDPTAGTLFVPTIAGGVYIRSIATLGDGSTVEDWSDILTVSPAHAPPPPPSPTPLRALIVGQSYSVDYGNFWSGRIRQDNPLIEWLDPQSGPDEGKFNQAGAGIGTFETWLADILALAPDIVFVSVKPRDFVERTSRYAAFCQQLTNAGIKVIIDEPWAYYDEPEGVRAAAIAELHHLHHSGGVAAVAETGTDPIFSTRAALDNPVIFKQDGTPHPEGINDAEGRVHGGHSWLYHFFSRALEEVVPGSHVHPYPVVTDAHQPAPPTEPVPPDHVGHEPPPPAGDVLASSVPEIPSNFDMLAYLSPRPLPPTAYPDVVGAFRFDWNPSHLSYNDPIVYPGQAGKAHGHLFFGNTGADHNSTYESLRTSGRGTTNGDAINRSAYWKPWWEIDDVILIGSNGTGYYKRLAKREFLTPEHFAEVLKRSSQSFLDKYAPGMTLAQAAEHISRLAIAAHDKHLPVGAVPVDIPRGLRVLAKTGEFILRPSPENGGGEFKVGSVYNGVRMTFAELMDRARPGDKFTHVVHLPNMWDGRRVDSADHMAHMGEVRWNGATGRNEVVGEHKYMMPRVTLLDTYVIQPGLDYRRMQLSSDRAMGAEPGSTSHVDYWEAWPDEIRRETHAHAMDRLLNCSGGDMGSGRGLKRSFAHSFGFTPSTVPLASVPTDGRSLSLV